MGDIIKSGCSSQRGKAVKFFLGGRRSYVQDIVDIANAFGIPSQFLYSEQPVMTEDAEFEVIQPKQIGNGQ